MLLNSDCFCSDVHCYNVVVDDDVDVAVADKSRVQMKINLHPNVTFFFALLNYAAKSYYSLRERAFKIYLSFCCQFHQHFTCSFFGSILAPKIQKQILSRGKLHITLSYKKAARKMLVKLTSLLLTFLRLRLMLSRNYEMKLGKVNLVICQKFKWSERDLLRCNTFAWWTWENLSW